MAGHEPTGGHVSGRQQEYRCRQVVRYLTCTRQEETVEVHPNDVVIVEGILVLTDPTLRLTPRTSFKANDSHKSQREMSVIAMPRE